MTGMPAPLDESAVRHVASLARLHVPDAEIAAYASQLARVLAYVDQLNELNTNDIPATAHPLPVHNVFREDVEQPSWPQDRALAAAPQTQQGCFKVPKVLDQEGS